MLSQTCFQGNREVLAMLIQQGQISFGLRETKNHEGKYHGNFLQIKNKNQWKVDMIKYAVEALAPLHNECCKLQKRSLLPQMNYLYLHEIVDLVFLPLGFQWS